MSKLYTDEGIVLARKNYQEGDRILILYTKNHGKVSLLAKGVRKLASRKRGHLEVFSHLKFQATVQPGFGIITEAQTVDSFEVIRASLKKVTVAYYFCEAVGRMTREGEKHQEIFELLVEYLNRLKITDALKSLRLDFVTDILITLGFWPRGERLLNPDLVLEETVERQMSSARVGRQLLAQ